MVREKREHTMEVPESAWKRACEITGLLRPTNYLRERLEHWAQWSEQNYTVDTPADQVQRTIVNERVPVIAREHKTYPRPESAVYMWITRPTECNGCRRPLATNGPEQVVREICVWQPTGRETKHFFCLDVCSRPIVQHGGSNGA